MRLRFYNAKILTMENENIINGELCTDGGKISYVGEQRQNGDFDRDCIFSTGEDADVDLDDDCFYPYEYIIINMRTDDFVDTIYAQKPLNPKEVRKRMKKADVRKNCPYKVRMYINGFYEKEFKFRTNKNANVRY